MILFLPLIIVSSVAFGEGWTGRVFGDAYFRQRQNQPKLLNQAYLGGWLGRQDDWTDTFKSKFVGELYVSSSDVNLRPYSRDVVGDLREGFVSGSGESWNVSVGRIFILWGKADGISVVDVLTAKDLTFFNPDDEVRRKAGTGVKATWTPRNGEAPFSITGVAQIWAPRGDFYVPERSFVYVMEPETQKVSMQDTEWGLKGEYQGEGWDGSLMYFSGFNHMPHLRLKEITGGLLSPLVVVEKTYRRHQMWGTDFSYGFEHLILRGELAYFQTDNPNAATSLYQPDHWDSMLGVERPVGNDVRILFQGLYRYYPILNESSPSGSGLVESIALQGLAKSNALIHQYQDQHSVLGLTRVSWTKEDTDLDAELTVIYNFKGKDSLVRPKVSYLPKEDWRLSLGMDLYGGSHTRALGLLGPYSSFFVESKYTF